MTKDEALKLALEAFEAIPEEIEGWIPDKCTDAVIAIKEALAQPDATMQSLKDLKRSVCDEAGKAAFAQPEQEPVAWHTEDHLTDRSATTYSKDMVYRWECKGWPVTPLYTTPPQRPWVGLTDGEYKELHLQMGPVYYYQEYGQAIEAKLKEKNGA